MKTINISNSINWESVLIFIVISCEKYSYIRLFIYHFGKYVVIPYTKLFPESCELNVPVLIILTLLNGIGAQLFPLKCLREMGVNFLCPSDPPTLHFLFVVNFVTQRYSFPSRADRRKNGKNSTIETQKLGRMITNCGGKTRFSHWLTRSIDSEEQTMLRICTLLTVTSLPLAFGLLHSLRSENELGRTSSKLEATYR